MCPAGFSAAATAGSISDPLRVDCCGATKSGFSSLTAPAASPLGSSGRPDGSMGALLSGMCKSGLAILPTCCRSILPKTI